VTTRPRKQPGRKTGSGGRRPTRHSRPNGFLARGKPLPTFTVAPFEGPVPCAQCDELGDHMIVEQAAGVSWDDADAWGPLCKPCARRLVFAWTAAIR
jgi:hypothetical protein